MTEQSDGGFVHRPVQLSGGGTTGEWGIAVEAPVELQVNGEPWTMMLATPEDLEDLAVGLALTEQLVADAAAVAAIRISHYLGDWTAELTIDAPAWPRRARSLTGNTACGLCGLESLAAFRAGLDRLPGVESRPVITDAAIQAAWRALPQHQPINQATRSVHAAAWCTVDGEIVLVREDVGRHNALDKLVGALARQQQLGRPGFVTMTSRCSVELVAKAAIARAALLATISAPTTLALTWSETLGVPLASAGADRQVVRFPTEATHARC
ncbi:MAG: formate dehydrogenase accessory sulfurtransferase FdhD [Gemmatimonadales bacterium]|nr:formate dehydrogenase accessory sulfurtransferase FdhD [Gemmatimonadales bacterium]MDZ4389029.1 formate dehydrogenase accessory sulfurtransferase FdhD [Gemmatimonadales bacterium]